LWEIFTFYGRVNGRAPTEITDDEENDGVFDALEKSHDISQPNIVESNKIQ
jgi:hypothetical protein